MWYLTGCDGSRHRLPREMLFVGRQDCELMMKVRCLISILFCCVFENKYSYAVFFLGMSIIESQIEASLNPK